MKIQQFLNEFAFSELNNVYQQLKESPEFILKKAQYKYCPIQQNGHDCSLFGLITLIHLVNGKPIDSFTFSQSDITIFWQCFFNQMELDVLPDATKELSPSFVYEFFPSLQKDVPQQKQHK
jgi:hypothetical protein